MSKVKIETLNVTPEQLFGRCLLNKIVKMPLWKKNEETNRNELVEGQFSGVEVIFTSEQQGREVVISVPFYKYQSDELVVTPEQMNELINYADTLKMFTPIQLLGMRATLGTDNAIRENFNATDENNKHVKRTFAVFDIYIDNIKVVKNA